MKLSKMALIVGMCATSSLFSYNYNYMVINNTNRQLTITSLDNQNVNGLIENDKTQGFNQSISLTSYPEISITLTCSSGSCSVVAAKGIGMIDKDSADPRLPKKYILYPTE